MKKCRKCGCELEVGINWYESHARNRNYICIECKRVYTQEYSRDHREEKLARRRKRYLEQREKKSAYYKKNREAIIAYNRQYRQDHQEEIAARKRQYQQDHREEIAARKRKYSHEHREEIAVYFRERYQTNIQYRLTCGLRTRLRRALKGDTKSGSAVRDLGCSIPELVARFESQFREGMTWDNYGEWQIDHIVPLSSFDLTNRKQLLQACHYTNLQPLWAYENSSKGAKTDLFSGVVNVNKMEVVYESL